MTGSFSELRLRALDAWRQAEEGRLKVVSMSKQALPVCQIEETRQWVMLQAYRYTDLWQAACAARDRELGR
jgi:hypothetical protein